MSDLQETIYEEFLAPYDMILFAEKYFDKNTIKYIEDMAKNIIEVFKSRIETLSWMNNSAKEKARKELSDIETSDERTEKLRYELELAEKELKAAAKTLSQLRKKAAIKLTQKPTMAKIIIPL